MATRTMSFNSNSPEQWHLARKLALLFLLVIASALGLVILLRQANSLPLVMFNLFADVSIGLVIGLATRMVLNQRHGAIQALVSAALAVVGLLVLGYFTNAKAGIGPLPLRLVQVDWLGQWHIPLKLPLQIEHGQMNWPALAYLAITMDISWIALRVWKPSTPRAAESSSTPSRRVRQSAHSSRSSVASNPPSPKVRIARWNPRPKVRKMQRPLISKSAASGSAKSSRSKNWNPLHRKPAIQLAVYEEHRCPYCFEEVKRDDPRGVVECEVCHTLHHKDCWDVTGACQVPHLNT
ncbi:MAG: hypothetical protein M1282_03265 [Chloroflexi bacterium]|nr:hypothetical protein [Chloroflexota bacterium]